MALDESLATCERSSPMCELVLVHAGAGWDHHEDGGDPTECWRRYCRLQVHTSHPMPCNCSSPSARSSIFSACAVQQCCAESFPALCACCVRAGCSMDQVSWQDQLGGEKLQDVRNEGGSSHICAHTLTVNGGASWTDSVN